MKTIVLKFGGASVKAPENFAAIADLVLARRRDFPRVVVVVSAMGETTDQLIQLAKSVHPNPPQREYDMLISVGERISMSLLAMALARKGAEAMSFTGSQSGIITCCRHSDAKIIDVRPSRLSQCLDEGKIAIVAGFQGISTRKEITTLGRGGSDTTAVALALALNATEIEFYKDVPGVFNMDPKIHVEATQYHKLNYDDALTIVSRGARILHDRALRLAKSNGMPLHVRSFKLTAGENEGTFISDNVIERASKPLYEEENISI